MFFFGVSDKVREWVLGLLGLLGRPVGGVLPVFPTVMGMLLLLPPLLTPIAMRPQGGRRKLKGRHRWRPDQKARQQWKKKTLHQRAGATGSASSANHRDTHTTTLFISSIGLLTVLAGTCGLKYITARFGALSEGLGAGPKRNSIPHKGPWGW